MTNKECDHVTNHFNHTINKEGDHAIDSFHHHVTNREGDYSNIRNESNVMIIEKSFDTITNLAIKK